MHKDVGCRCSKMQDAGCADSVRDVGCGRMWDAGCGRIQNADAAGCRMGMQVCAAEAQLDCKSLATATRLFELQ